MRKLLSVVPHLLAALWVTVWLLLGVLALISPAHGSTAKIGVFVDSPSITEADARRLVDEASVIFQQAGVKLELDSYRVVKPSLHNNPAYVLDDVIEERMQLRDSTQADIHVLLTERALFIGSSNYAGYATGGPACTVHQAAVVHLISPSMDALTLAHEIAHTFGAEHDSVPGWLMSSNSSPTMSPDTLGVIRGSLLDCMQDKPAQAVVQDLQSEPTGGGGSLHLWFILVLAAFVVIFRIRT